VFGHLIESSRKTTRRVLWLGFVSLVGHSGGRARAVVAELTAGQKKDDTAIDTAMVFLTRRTEKPKSSPRRGCAAVKGSKLLSPRRPPRIFPPINLQEHFDPKDSRGRASEGGIGNGASCRRPTRCSWSRSSRSG